MNLADVAAGGGSASLSASASIPEPADAIAQGGALFDQAYTKAGGSITGTVAVAASVVSDLPAGQAKQLLQTVLGLASGAAAGAAMGSVVPGWGTAVGAAVGAVMGLVGQMFSSAPQPPEGDVRSSAEQMCFPAVPNVTPADTEPGDLLQEQYAQPVSWADIRIHSPGYQPPFEGTDPATGQSCPVAFTFATGWVSPPQSTPTSKQAAWYLAQAWLGRGAINKWFALSASYNGPGEISERHAAANAATQQAGTLLGDDALVTKALALVDRWYGTRWGTNGTPWAFGYALTKCPGVNPNFGWTPPSSANTLTKLATGWQKLAICLNQWDALDYAYYFSETLVIRQTQRSQFSGVVQDVIPVDIQEAWGGGSFFAAMPDTTLVALCELAALVVLGVIPEAGVDHVALHFVMALAWLWRRGQEKDKNLGRPFAVHNHDNFSRLIGLLAHRVRTTKQAAAVKAKATATAKAKTAAAAKAKATATNTARARAAATAAAHPGTAMVVATPTAIVPVAPATNWKRELVELVVVTALAGGVLVWTRRT